ncbi:MAG: hypothetical protein PHU94_01510 [Bacilli bacterium]|nr:hypothetical protein [Bacilli bacterium]MDD4733950.1 hypothetical protein [Bacilli bacterium]
MFDYVIKYAKENGYKSVFLTCLDTAYGAQKLYETIGFIKTDSLKYNLKI